MALASASRTTGHGLGLGGQVLGLGRRVLGLGKHVLGLKYFSVLWLKLTVNFITNFENLAVKMKLVFTSPAINVCVLKFWLNSEPYWHWPWHRPALALEAKSLALRAVALTAKANHIDIGLDTVLPWPWRPSPWPWGLWPCLLKPCPHWRL